MKKIDIASVPARRGSGYPAPHDAAVRAREVRRIGDAAGLQHLGVSHVRVPPGAWSSQRHWHGNIDEFVVVLEGEIVLITDDGEELLRAGDCAAFRAGEANGHRAENRSSQDAVLLAFSSKSEFHHTEYSDIDMRIDSRVTDAYVHKDGTPYAP